MLIIPWCSHLLLCLSLAFLLLLLAVFILERPQMFPLSVFSRKCFSVCFDLVFNSFEIVIVVVMPCWSLFARKICQSGRAFLLWLLLFSLYSLFALIKQNCYFVFIFFLLIWLDLHTWFGFEYLKRINTIATS